MSDTGGVQAGYMPDRVQALHLPDKGGVQSGHYQYRLHKSQIQEGYRLDTSRVQAWKLTGYRGEYRLDTSRKKEGYRLGTSRIQAEYRLDTCQIEEG